MKVLILHNRYRIPGGEERAVELHARALADAGIAYEVLERASSSTGALRAGRAMLRGGVRDDEVAAAVRSTGATVVHVHNMNPLFGPRALAAARAAGAAVVLHLHNFRLFCSIAVAFRDGEPCFRCRGRLTLPGAVLNCRGSVPESAVYATALSLHQPAVFRAVDRFATLSGYAAGQLVRLGVPADRLDVIPNFLPGEAIAGRSRAAEGTYALIAGRLSREKGVEVAIEAAARSGVPLKIAGEGPLEHELRAQAAGKPVEFVGRVPQQRVRELMDGAAMAIVPSLGGDVMPFAALEAMARGLPVIASKSGSLPELVGDELCVPRGQIGPLARAMRARWDDPERRQHEGERMRAIVHERFSEQRFVASLRSLYERAAQA